jgi:competence protein ComEA
VQAALVVIVVGLIVGFVTHSLLHGNIQRPVANPGEAPLSPIDLNHASQAELQLLPGLGPKMAERIDAYRILYGRYRSVDDLRKVPGIGPKTIERLRPWLIVSGTTRPSTASSPAPAESMRRDRIELPRPGAKELNLTELIDINSASAAELDRLPGIGPKLAQRILDARAAAPFTKVEDLRRVPGIGPKTLEKVRPYVTVGAASLARNE